MNFIKKTKTLRPDNPLLHECVAMLQIAKRTCVSVHSLLCSLDTRGERGEEKRAARPVRPEDKEDMSGTGFIEFGELLKYKSGPNIAVNIIKSPQRGVARVPGPL